MTQKLQLIALSSFLIMLSMKGWLVDRFDFNISIGIYFTIFILAYSYKAELLAYAYERLQKNILDVDFLILAFLTLHFIINYHISINGLSFAALFIQNARAQNNYETHTHTHTCNHFDTE